MASIEATVKTPYVPDYLEVEVPGRARVMRLPLATFSTAELERVGAEWTRELVATADVQKAAGVPEPKKRAPRAPKE